MYPENGDKLVVRSKICEQFLALGRVALATPYRQSQALDGTYLVPSA